MAFVYMAFACLHVTTCRENRPRLKVVNSSVKISGTNNLPHKTSGSFLSRPRVLRKKLVNEFIITVIAVCLFAISAACLIKQIKYVNTFLLARRPPQIILLRNIRL